MKILSLNLESWNPFASSLFFRDWINICQDTLVFMLWFRRSLVVVISDARHERAKAILKTVTFVLSHTTVTIVYD